MSAKTPMKEVVRRTDLYKHYLVSYALARVGSHDFSIDSDMSADALAASALGVDHGIKGSPLLDADFLIGAVEKLTGFLDPDSNPDRA